MNDVWTNTYRYIYEYSSGNILQNLKYQIWKDEVWQNADKILPFRDKYYEYRHEGYELNLQFIPVSVQELQSLIHINLYPNPAGDYIEISLHNGASPIASEIVQIFNTFGLDVSPAGGGVSGADGGGFRINISNLPVGVYYIRIGDKVEKFVKK